MGPEAQDRCQRKTKNQAREQGKNMADGAEGEPWGEGAQAGNVLRYVESDIDFRSPCFSS